MPAQHNRPNVVFILADDLGYGDFSAFNDGRSSTPTLDHLLTESVCLSQHYAGSAVCNPSRAALLTGRYPHRTGSLDTLEWWGLERLALREITLADLFQAAGYATGLVGKWHLGAFDPRYHPNRRGFDEAVCFRGGMHDYYNWRLEYNDRIARADGRYLTDVWTDEAVAFIDRHHAEPFFLHVTFNAPHTPLAAPVEEIRPFLETGQFNLGVSMIYAMIHRMDRGIARILDALAAHGLAENTIVVFTSDNGPQFGGPGEHDTTRFNCQFHGAKGTVYEGGIRVPALVRWPAGNLAGGSRYDGMAHMTDWFPTLAAAAGLPLPTDRKLDGANILPALCGEPAEDVTRRFWQWNRFLPLVECNAAMRDGDWKLVRPAIREAMAVPDVYWLPVSMYDPEHFIRHGILTGPFPARDIPPPSPPELYHLADDPLEQHDLAGAQPERVAAMLRALETWFEEVEAERATIVEAW